MRTQSRNSRLTKQAGLAGLLGLVMLVLAACQSGMVPATGATATALPAPTATVASNPTAQPVVEAELSITTDPKLGKILVGKNGLTLYMFTKDEADKSNCAGGCLAQWPPLLTQGQPDLGEGIDPTLVGSADLPDGSKIVTYNKMPLYYWVGDKKAGDTTGQGVGEVWWVVSPDGKVIGNDGMSTKTDTGNASASEEAQISVVRDPKLGDILVGKNGMTLYMFTKDEANKSNCAGECLAKWPPLLTQGQPVLGEGVDPALVSAADLSDGSKIVTYNKMPLYYWVNDAKAGDTTGQGVGEVWWVISPDGKVIGKENTSASGYSYDETAGGKEVEEAELSIATDPKLGKILIGHNGMTLYIFTKDEANKSNCAGECLAKWPPLLTQGNPVLDDGVDPKLVGTAKLADDSLIVTYNGMPLYYWVKDGKPGDTTGQGVGGVWWVISPEGKIIGQ